MTVKMCFCIGPIHDCIAPLLYRNKGPCSNKWPMFRENMDKFMGIVRSIPGAAGYHLAADDLEGIQQKFEEIGALMADPGLDEHL